jgi:hypothetical protein
MPKRPRRNKRLDAPHVRLYRWMLDPSAYLSLSRQVRAVLLEIARGHAGTNNGRLGLSIRRASERCNIARGTAQRAFDELQDRGFVDCMKKVAFSRKAPHATEWRLICWSSDVTGELASKKFMSWGSEKQTRYQNIPSRLQIRASVLHDLCEKSFTVPSFDTVRLPNDALAVSV